MSFLSRLFRDDWRPTPPPTDDDAEIRFAVAIVGESHYEESFLNICGPRTDESVDVVCDVVLVLEDGNPHDPKAVRVDVRGWTVGYLDRQMARAYRKALGAGKVPTRCQARIRGGWDRGARGRGGYGVALDLPLTFG